MNEKISVSSLVKIFYGSKKDKTAINNISFNISDKESLAIVGCSGSGKSVLIKLIIGLMKPTSGIIKINGQDTTDLGEKGFNKMIRSMSVLFQGGALFDSMKVWRNISFGLEKSNKASKKELKDFAVHYLEMVGLEPDTVHLYPSELSGGMQKRVAFARALAKNPEIIFLDEPTTGLDPILTETIDNLIRSCCVHKMTTVTITHNIKSACKIADNILVLSNGNIVWHGPTNNIYTVQNEHVQKLLSFGM